MYLWINHRLQLHSREHTKLQPKRANVHGIVLMSVATFSHTPGLGRYLDPRSQCATQGLCAAKLNFLNRPHQKTRGKAIFGDQFTLY